MSNTIFWVLLIAYAAHIVEEYLLNWKDWAKNISKINLQWSEFFVVNFAVVIFGISSAMIGFDNLWIALLFPALMLINGLVAHIGVSIIKKTFSPGLITSIVLFLPLSLYTYFLVYEWGMLSVSLFSLQ